MESLTVQQLIDELQQVEDKSIHIELCDLSGDRHKLLGTDIITDGADFKERNFDLNFDSKPDTTFDEEIA